MDERGGQHLHRLTPHAAGASIPADMDEGRPFEPRFCFRRDERLPERERSASPVTEGVPDEGSALVCVTCGQRITSTVARISVGGAHGHTFANPHGLVFRIGCFSTATGWVGVGEPTADFSWFPGYSWQVVQCAVCGLHLGWRFRSEGHQFHGFILDRLAEQPDRHR